MRVKREVWIENVVLDCWIYNGHCFVFFYISIISLTAYWVWIETYRETKFIFLLVFSVNCSVILLIALSLVMVGAAPYPEAQDFAMNDISDRQYGSYGISMNGGYGSYNKQADTNVDMYQCPKYKCTQNPAANAICTFSCIPEMDTASAYCPTITCVATKPSACTSYKCSLTFPNPVM